jgi:hypothetical protein
MKGLRLALVAFAMLLVATTTRAQQTTRVSADIPFDFVVGDHTYPAGEYSLKSVLDDGSVILIANMQTTASRNVGSHPCASTTRSTQTKLVFRKMGDNYFLYQVWLEGSFSGREFPNNRAEKLLAKRHEKSEQTVVAANFSQ